MVEMLPQYRTDDGVRALCEDCACKHRQAGERCEWAETPAHREQARLSCQCCGAVVEELPRPSRPRWTR
jgi:hypothetical protein